MSRRLASEKTMYAGTDSFAAISFRNFFSLSSKPSSISAGTLCVSVSFSPLCPGVFVPDKSRSSKSFSLFRLVVFSGAFSRSSGSFINTRSSSLSRLSARPSVMTGYSPSSTSRKPLSIKWSKMSLIRCALTPDMIANVLRVSKPKRRIFSFLLPRRMSMIMVFPKLRPRCFRRNTQETIFLASVVTSVSSTSVKQFEQLPQFAGAFSPK